jgi:hypothetical protein
VRVVTLLTIADDTPLPPSSPSILRVWENSGEAYDEIGTSAPTVVVFAWRDDPIGGGRACGCPDCVDPFSYGWGDDDPVPETTDPLHDTAITDLEAGVEKLVINFSCYSINTDEWNLRLVPFFVGQCDSLKEVVIHFAFRDDAYEAEMALKTFPARLRTVLHAIVSAFPIFKYTFVNSAFVPLGVVRKMAQLTGIVWDADVPSLENAFSNGESFQACAEKWFAEAAQSKGRVLDVEYLSSEEYKARVGTERFHHETSMDYWWYI